MLRRVAFFGLGLGLVLGAGVGPKIVSAESGVAEVSSKLEDLGGDEDLGAGLNEFGDLSDLGEGGSLDPKLDAKVVALLSKARKLIDRHKYPEASSALKEADQLSPMDDRVLSLLDMLGQLSSEKDDAGKVLSKIRAEERAEKAEQRRSKNLLGMVLKRNHLPHKLKTAIRRLATRLAQEGVKIKTLSQSRDRCIAGATMAHAAAGARRCSGLEVSVKAARKQERLLRDDLQILDEAYKKRFGKKALAKLKRRQKR